MTFIVAVLAILLGLVCLGAYKQDADGNAFFIAIGVAQILYGVLALVILIKNGAESSRTRI